MARTPRGCRGLRVLSPDVCGDPQRLHHPRICCTVRSGCEAQSLKAGGRGAPQASLRFRAQPIRTCHAEASWNLPSLAQGQIKALLSSSGGSQSGVEQQLFPQQNLPAWVHPLMGSSLPLETVREHLQCWHGPRVIEGGSRGSQRGDPRPGPLRG